MHNYPVLEKDKETCSSITIWTILKSVFLAKMSGALKRKKEEKKSRAGSIFYVTAKLMVICWFCRLASPGHWRLCDSFQPLLCISRQAGWGGGRGAGGGRGVPFIGAQAKDPLISESQNPSFQLYGFY